MNYGIDLSAWQTQIDFQKVAQSGISFCYVKLTDGIHGVNNLDASQSVNAQKAGIKTGYYHFGHPEKNDPKLEAFWFLSQIRSNAIPTADLIPALDIEGSYINGVEQKVRFDTLQQWVLDFAKVMADGGFPKILLYSNPNFLNTHLPKGHVLSSFPLWLSEYAGHVISLPVGWAEWTIWQNSGTGHVDGVVGNVDTNQCPDLTPILLG